MGTATLAMAVDFDTDGHKEVFDPLGLIYIVYAGLWGGSILLQFFEYKRNIPHAWYTHQLFWTMSCVMNCFILAAILLFLQDSFKFEKAMEIKYLITHSIFIAVSLVLSYMGFKYKREHP